MILSEFLKKEGVSAVFENETRLKNAITNTQRIVKAK